MQWTFPEASLMIRSEDGPTRDSYIWSFFWVMMQTLKFHCSWMRWVAAIPSVTKQEPNILRLWTNTAMPKWSIVIQEDEYVPDLPMIWWLTAVCQQAASVVSIFMHECVRRYNRNADTRLVVYQNSCSLIVILFFTSSNVATKGSSVQSVWQKRRKKIATFLWDYHRVY